MILGLQVLTFLMMYRTHCQRILDTVIRANFDEVGTSADEMGSSSDEVGSFFDEVGSS